MGSTKMTSYERVYNALLTTSTCKEVLAAAKKSIQTVKVKSVEWRLSTTDDTASAVPTFLFTEEFSWSGDTTHSECAARTFLTNTMTRKVIDVHFGPEKDVKTFNCSPDIVKTGGTVSRKTDWGREKEYQNDFHDFLMDKFVEDVGADVKAATKRLRAEIEVMRATPEFKQSQREALIGFCKETLTRALLPWHEMEQSVLEEAWDQFICTAIMRN